MVMVVSAQTRISILGGLHNASVTPSWTMQPGASAQVMTNRTGAHFGFQAFIPLSENSKVFFQPGVIYSAKGSMQEQVFDTSVSLQMRYTHKQFLNYIDLPMNLVVKLPIKRKTSFIFGGGPQASLFYNGLTSESSTDKYGGYQLSTNEDLAIGKGESQFKLLHFGVNALAGFEIGRVFITANYTRGLTPYVTQNQQSYTHGTFGATLGIHLGSMKQEAVKETPAKFKKEKITKEKTIKEKPAKESIAKEKVVKIKDRDKDGVPDNLDECPRDAGSSATNGCPDSDGDGIADKKDACPFRNGTAEFNGCPIPDKDGDGIPDKEDQCSTVPGLAKYKGCPMPDRDNDGIADEEDKCPDAEGSEANKGCPEVANELQDKMAFLAQRIQFEYQKYNLSPESIKILNDVAQILKENAEMRLTVEGHTSGSGDDDANHWLAQQRAYKVKEHLVWKGISSKRIDVVGYGATRPLFKETTEAQRARNRRVELRLSY